MILYHLKVKSFFPVEVSGKTSLDFHQEFLSGTEYVEAIDIFSFFFLQKPMLQNFVFFSVAPRCAGFRGFHWKVYKEVAHWKISIKPGIWRKKRILTTYEKRLARFEPNKGSKKVKDSLYRRYLKLDKTPEFLLSLQSQMLLDQLHSFSSARSSRISKRKGRD